MDLLKEVGIRKGGHNEIPTRPKPKTPPPSQSILKGYQPIKDELDNNNPPKGGSGVPNNDCQKKCLCPCMCPLIGICLENIEPTYIY